jgi:hypothetical protein
MALSTALRSTCFVTPVRVARIGHPTYQLPAVFNQAAFIHISNTVGAISVEFEGIVQPRSADKL